MLFRIGLHEKKGRVLIANETIETGVNIIVEPAFAYSTHCFEESCFVCLRKLVHSTSSNENLGIRCESCSLLFCSADCRLQHYFLMCKCMNSLRDIAQRTHVDLGLLVLIFNACISVSGATEYNQFYSSLKESLEYFKNYSSVFDMVCSLGTHQEDIDPEYIFTFKKCAENLYQLFNSMLDIDQSHLHLNIEKIIDLFCIVFVNAHGLCPVGFISDNGIGLFPLVSLISHDCDPNCCFVTIGYTIFVRPVRRIEKDEELTIPYVDLLKPTHLRRKNLLQSKYFVCECSRCTSPTEDNRFLKAYKCEKCADGYYNPIYAYDDIHYRANNNISAEDMEHALFENLFLSDGNISFEGAFSAFDALYSKESESNFDLIQKIIYYRCNICNAESIRDFEAIEREILEALRDEDLVLPMIKELISKYDSLMHRNHFLLFELRTKQLALNNEAKYELDDSAIQACFQHLIRFCEEILPKNHFEAAEYCLLYVDYLEKSEPGELELIKHLRAKAFQHYNIIYPKDHHAHFELKYNE